MDLNYDPNTGVWAEFRGNPKFIGEDVFVTAVRSESCSLPEINNPEIPWWTYSFTDRDGRVSMGQVGPLFAPLPRGDLRLSGCRWVFVPDHALTCRPPSNVCFAIRCTCR